MRPSSWRILCAAAVCGAGLCNGREAAAQSGAGAVPSLAPNPNVQTMLAVSALSSTVATPPSNPTGSAGGTSVQSGGIFNNPMAAPILYNSMIGASLPQGQSNAYSSATANLGTTQLGMMLLLANQQNGGLGSGRISGTRGGPQQRASAGSQPGANAKSRSSDRPGGLASRYFNRSASHPAYPRTYFNRRPSFFP